MANPWLVTLSVSLQGSGFTRVSWASLACIRQQCMPEGTCRVRAKGRYLLERSDQEWSLVAKNSEASAFMIAGGVVTSG